MIIARLTKTHEINGNKIKIEYNAYQTGASAYKIVETYTNGAKKHYEFSSFDSLNDCWNNIKSTNYNLEAI